MAKEGLIELAYILDPVTRNWLQGINNSWQRKGVTKGQSLQLPLELDHTGSQTAKEKETR
ncbi:UNVERIFIED_CONTAM: hypothetical protein Slati_4518300 [Sesamum latifolium]|uniref:Uncharacterized protein n=1 Tax=Sesamum latifolium TaxID=2727402 RepID=A0AAW2SIA6_9LAMI